MPFREPIARERLVVGLALYAGAVAAGAAAWTHAASIGAAAFLCGDLEGGHCLACYAAPALAALGVVVLAAPERASGGANSRPAAQP